MSPFMQPSNSVSVPESAFMGLEQAMVARIRGRLSDIAGLRVETAMDLHDIVEAAQHTPSIYVVYGGPYPRLDGNGMVELSERWFTVLAVRNASSAGTGEGVRVDAGPILRRLFGALLGWQYAEIKPLLPVVPPLPGWRAGFAYFSLAWEARFAKFPMPCPVV